MNQILFIHGGDTFETYEEYLDFLNKFEIDKDYFEKKRWKDSFEKELGSDFEMIFPRMPNSANARYLEWKIWFEKFIPFLKDEIILIGHSLGGIFLAKYLSENNFPKKIKATFLLAAPFDSADSDYTLADFVLPESLSKFENQSEKIILYHSKDDPVVPFADLEKYKKQLPGARYRVFEDKEHFNQEDFPEIIEDIRNL